MQTYVTLAVFLAMAVCFCIRRIPMAVTAVLGLVVLVATGCVTPSQALGNIGSSVAVTMASMFVLAHAFAKTSFVSSITLAFRKVGKGSFTASMLMLCVLTFVLGQFIPSTTALFLLMYPLAVSLAGDCGVKPSKVIYSVGLVCVATSFTIMPVGPYAASFIEDNGYLAQYGLSHLSFTPFSETLVKLPGSLFIILWAVFVAPRLTRSNAVSASVGRIVACDQPDSGNNPGDKTGDQPGDKLPKGRQVFVLVLFCCVAVTLVCSSFGLPVWLVPLVAACLLVLTGCVGTKEVPSSIGLPVILLYAGVATLGNAFASTQAGEVVGKAVSSVLGGTSNSYVAGAVFFIASFLMTSVLYNRAASKILIPIVLAGAASLSCDPRGLMIMCYLGSMSSLVTPMATSIVPMMMDRAGYNQRDLLRMGLLPALGMCVISVAVGMTMFPLF